MWMDTQLQFRLIMSLYSAYGRRPYLPVHHIFKHYYCAYHSIMWISSISRRRRMSLPMQCLHFNPISKWDRWWQKRHQPNTHTYYRNSSRFSKHCRIQTSDSRTHNTGPTNANSNEWLARVKKELSPATIALLDLQRRDQCREWVTIQKLHTFIPEMFCNWTL